jgi:hypothetical protein
MNHAAQPKLQHWVSRFYLRYFSTPETRNDENPEVWVCFTDKVQLRSYTAGIRRVAAEKFLYSPKLRDGTRDFSVEAQLGELESVLAPVWRHLAIGAVNLGKERRLKELLALFVATQMIRVPDHLKRVEAMYKKMVAVLDTFPKDEKGCPDIKSLPHQGSDLHFDNSGWQDFRNADKAEIQRMFSRQIASNTHPLAEALLNKRWFIVMSAHPEFVTSDRPVTILNAGKLIFGAGTVGTVIHFPLSPTRMLCLDDNREAPENQYYHVRPEDGFLFNVITVHHASRFVIADRDPSDLVNRVHLHLNKRRRIAANRGPSNCKPGRNDPCPCGSGKKYKRCCSIANLPEN